MSAMAGSVMLQLKKEIVTFIMDKYRKEPKLLTKFVKFSFFFHTEELCIAFEGNYCNKTFEKVL